MIKRVLFFFFILVSQNLFAQFFETGSEPFGTKWRQIKTDRFSIIFPKDAENIAKRYANLLSIVDSISPKSLQSKQRRFDVVVHNHSVLSNAFVAWAPKRMEIIAQPSSSTYAQPWLTQLAVHETRHTSQLFKLNGGLIKPLSFVFGEQAVGYSAALVPAWFFEGDAVTFETAITNSGRGRQADFYQYYRAHYLTRNKKFNYDKFLLGSFRDKIPDHYSLGYQLVSFAKVNYGNQVWANTLRYVSQCPLPIAPFYFGLKAQTGLSRKALFKKTFNSLDTTWRANLKVENIKKYNSINLDSKEYSDYRFPHVFDEKSIIANKTSLSSTSRFIQIDRNTKKEKTVVWTGKLTSNPSYYNESIFWTEYKPHVRWEYKNFSVIYWYDMKRARLSKISDNGLYFSPVYNAKDGLVYAYQGNDDGSGSIVAFNLSGQKTKTISLPNYYQPYELSYDNEHEQLILGVVTDNGKMLLWLNDDGSTKLIYGPTFRDIHSITSAGNLMYFSTTEGYKEDIFALNLQNNHIFKITKTEFGATDPKIELKTGEIIFANFTARGYSLSTSIIDTTGSKVELSNTNDDKLTTLLKASEKFNIDSTNIPNNNYQVKRFNIAKRFINFHSWAPFYYDINQLMIGVLEIKPGITVNSQSLTGTSILSAAYGYDNSHITHINYSYKGFLPVISLDFKIISNSPSIYKFSENDQPATERQSKETKLKIYLPLKLSERSFITWFYPMVQVISKNDYLFSTSDSMYHKGLYKVDYSVYFASTKRQAHKNLRPRLGFEMDLNYQNAPFNKNNLGSIFTGQFSIYLPGVGLNHSLLIKPSIQHQNFKHYIYSNNITFPRGYINYKSEKFRSITAEYLLPVAYPDIALGSIAYIKRISLNTFFDYAVNQFPSSTGIYKYSMQSFGLEFYTDVHLFRTQYPIKFKYQQGWAGKNLLPFNNFSFFIDFYGR